MAPRRRYYSDDDLERGISPSELKRAGRERQKEYMRHWFYRNFEDPVHETPYNGQEGGYLFIWGGPYGAADELWNEFGAFIPEARLEEVIKEIEDEGIDEWAPGPDHPATKEREEEWLRELAEQEMPPESESLEQIIDRLKSGVGPKYGDGYELEQRRAIREQLDTLRSTLVQVTPAHGGLGHNMPPPDDDSPQAVVVTEIRDAEETISKELAKPEPDALKVANATSRLRAALGWLGKKIDLAAESFAKGFGKTAGVAAAGGAALLAGKTLPPLMQTIGGIIQHVTQWLSYVTTPF